MSVVDTVEILKGSDLTDEEYFKAALLGWCIELVSILMDQASKIKLNLRIPVVQLQAYFLVADDMMDQSITRRGQPCWYRVVSDVTLSGGLSLTKVAYGQPGVGNIAINDAFLLEGAIYFLLKKHFRQEKYYVDLLELFHDVSVSGCRSQLHNPTWTVLLGHFPNGNRTVD